MGLGLRQLMFWKENIAGGNMEISQQIIDAIIIGAIMGALIGLLS